MSTAVVCLPMCLLARSILAMEPTYEETAPRGAKYRSSLAEALELTRCTARNFPLQFPVLVGQCITIRKIRSHAAKCDNYKPGSVAFYSAAYTRARQVTIKIIFEWETMALCLLFTSQPHYSPLTPTFKCKDRSRPGSPSSDRLA